MFLNLNTDPRDHSTCALFYNEVQHWLQAIWQGYIDPLEAQQGAEAYLQHAIRRPSPYLLNDNSQLRGPWFDSLDWLKLIWVPQAARLGLRYVAHVLQADQYYDILSLRQPFELPFELQIFTDLTEARCWLQKCQKTQFTA